MLTNITKNLVFWQKSANYFYVENDILQRLRDCFLNVTRMLTVLLTKFKYNIAAFNLNEYKKLYKTTSVNL